MSAEQSENVAGQPENVAAQLADVLREVGWPASVSWARGEQAEMSAARAELSGPDAYVVVWCRPQPLGSVLPSLPAITRWVELRRRHERGPGKRIAGDARLAVAAVVDRRLRAAHLAQRRPRPDADGSHLIWQLDERWWRLGVADPGELAFDVWDGSGWSEIVRFPLTADEAGVLAELLRLLAWLEQIAAEVETTPRESLAALLLKTVERIAEGGIGLRPSVADLRRRLAVGIKGRRLRWDGPQRPTRLADLFGAWQRVHALPPRLEAGARVCWLDGEQRVVRDVTVVGDPAAAASASAINALPVRLRVRWRLYRTARALRRAGSEPVIVATGRRTYAVVPRTELAAPLSQLPQLRHLAS